MIALALAAVLSCAMWVGLLLSIGAVRRHISATRVSAATCVGSSSCAARHAAAEQSSLDADSSV